MKSLYTLVIFLFSVSIFAQDPDLKINIPVGAKPWSSLELNNDSEQFQIAIVTDRTGGHRPGIFMDGVRKLNLLQPEFVMSVGDLIEGYTEDLDQLNREWDEFNGFIDSLEMPFFYVPGNHDITNEVMEKLYLEKFGKAYYHFVYKNVLFLCLNSEDRARGAGRGSISDPQYDWIKETLEENEDVRWTLVFLHQPLWNQDDPIRWPDVEKLLSNRKHTVFAGHVHHYAKYDRNNGKYFTLATTGGGSNLRGPELGEFDHVTWLTMTDEGPILANLQLEGIWGENVSTQKTREYAIGIINDESIKLPMLFQDSDYWEGEELEIRMTNDKDIPMKVKLNPTFSWDLRMEMESNTYTVPPNDVLKIPVYLKNKRKSHSISGIRPLKLKAEVRYEGEGIPRFMVPKQLLVAPVQKFAIEECLTEITIDGDLKEWSDLPFSIQEMKRGDCEATFGLSYDKEYVYVAAKIVDDDIQSTTENEIWMQDFLSIILNADPMEKSAKDKGRAWYRNSIFFIQSPGGELSGFTGRDIAAEGVQSICQIMPDGYVLESAIPISYVTERQGDDWKTLRFNFAIQDKDEGEKEMPMYLFQNDWRSLDNLIGSGMFFRK